MRSLKYPEWAGFVFAVCENCSPTTTMFGIEDDFSTSSFRRPGNADPTCQTLTEKPTCFTSDLDTNPRKSLIVEQSLGVQIVRICRILLVMCVGERRK